MEHKMKKMGRAFCIFVLFLFATVSYAGDAEAGKARSVTCAACHGGTGISPVSAYPNLAGQKQEYLAAQITAFRDGTRQNAQMTPMASGLSNEDIANLAAYYASLSCN
jgi:cytochrome c553